MDRKRSIAIDGPSGAGKSTLARLIARRFGFLYIDTGAIYRAAGLFVWRSGVSPEDRPGVLALLPQIDIALRHDQSGVQQIFLNGENVSEDIRMPEISIYTSKTAAIPEVRAFLLDMQRGFAEKYDVVMDGRDIGTAILPGADLKIFLTATPEDRARRRYAELRGKEIDTSYEAVLEDIRRRDRSDSERAASPLAAAPDAVVVDTTGYSMEESRDALIKLAEERFSDETSV